LTSYHAYATLISVRSTSRRAIQKAGGEVSSEPRADLNARQKLVEPPLTHVEL